MDLPLYYHPRRDAINFIFLEMRIPSEEYATLTIYANQIQEVQTVNIFQTPDSGPKFCISRKQIVMLGTIRFGICSELKRS